MTFCTEGKCACTWLDCGHIEVSASLNHRVDELLVGIVRQIRLARKHGSLAAAAEQRKAASHTYGGANCVKGAKEMIKEFFMTDICIAPSNT